MEINKIGVVGAGQMGAGIAQVAARCDISAWVHDLSLMRDTLTLAGITSGLALLQSMIDN